MSADDLVLWTTDRYSIIAKAKLKRNLLTLQTYCRLWKLKINSKKTVYPIFTFSHKMASKTLELKIDGEKLKKEDNPVYLGVKLDYRMTLTEHLENTKRKAVKRLNIIKKPSHNKLGSQKANPKTAVHRVCESCYGLQSSYQDYCKQRCRSLLRQSKKPGSKAHLWYNTNSSL